MKKYLTSLSLLFIVGCSAATQVPKNETTNTKVVKSEPTKTSIFTYHIDPDENYQTLARITGTFEWDNECIFLKTGDDYYTPMFPDAFTDWDEDTKTLTLDGHIFKMGDFIDTNGGYGTYKPNTGNGLEEQGDPKCLKPNVAGIGTLGLEKKLQQDIETG